MTRRPQLRDQNVLIPSIGGMKVSRRPLLISWYDHHNWGIKMTRRPQWLDQNVLIPSIGGSKLRDIQTYGISLIFDPRLSGTYLETNIFELRVHPDSWNIHIASTLYGFQLCGNSFGIQRLGIHVNAIQISNIRTKILTQKNTWIREVNSAIVMIHGKNAWRRHVHLHTPTHAHTHPPNSHLYPAIALQGKRGGKCK